ncbi:hypothetical protein [Paraburkholderia hayleyella]|uniref:hypothetical protein n=1 Tax=Paraburkholderia hayleyella TaxID=2152889 RepID=UPI001291D7D7|nr:hypothetical protein [Paraburkholderia hayleyella]
MGSAVLHPHSTQPSKPNRCDTPSGAHADSVAPSGQRPDLAAPNACAAERIDAVKRNGYGQTVPMSSDSQNTIAVEFITASASVTNLKLQTDGIAIFENSIKWRSYQIQQLQVFIDMLNDSIHGSNTSTYLPLRKVDIDSLIDPNGQPLAFSPSSRASPTGKDDLWYTSRESKEYLEQVLGMTWDTDYTRGPSNKDAADATVGQMQTWIKICQTTQNTLTTLNQQDTGQINKIEGQYQTDINQATDSIAAMTAAGLSVFT